jgi:hypothetical protein
MPANVEAATLSTSGWLNSQRLKCYSLADGRPKAILVLRMHKNEAKTSECETGCEFATI